MAHSKSRRTGEPAELVDPAADPDRLVVEVVCECGSEFEAGMVAARLQACGIDARANDPFPSREPGLVRNVVFVRRSDLDRAREVLATPFEPL
jgi:hypothetical protein